MLLNLFKTKFVIAVVVVFTLKRGDISAFWNLHEGATISCDNMRVLIHSLACTIKSVELLKAVPKNI